MPIVIDANIAISWFRSDPNELADRALDALSEHGAVVPALWRWEVQEVLRRLEAAGQLTLSVDGALAEMRQLPITIDDIPSGLFGSEMALAKRHGLSLYDASYLEVAVRHSLPLATIDKKLASAAKVAGASF